MTNEGTKDALSLIRGEPTSVVVMERKLAAYTKFILSLIMVCSYVIILSYPVVLRDIDLLKTVASILSGPVGMVLGYYFGSERR